MPDGGDHHCAAIDETGQVLLHIVEGLGDFPQFIGFADGLVAMPGMRDHCAFIRCLPMRICWICVVPSYRRSRRTSR